MDKADKGPPAGGWNRHFAALNRQRSTELRTEARDLTGDALRGAMRDAVWHNQEAHRLDAAVTNNEIAEEAT